MEWSDKLTLEFLHLYGKEPVIWDPRHPDHKDRNIIHDGWKRIQSRLGNNSSVADLKRKRENLMATYRKCVKKIETSCGGSNELYKPEWFAFETMESFLHTIYTPKAKIQGANAMSQMNVLRETEEVKREPEDGYDDTQLSYSSQRSEDENLFSPADSPATHKYAACDDGNLQPSAADAVQSSQQYTTNGDGSIYKPVPTSTAATHQLTVSDDENLLRLQVASSNIDDHYTVQRPSKRQRLDDDGEDRFDIIGRTFAMKMRGLPKNQMLIAERLMNETLFRAEMGLLNLNYRLASGSETGKHV